jgi:uncharacterized SAM-binding protein YcdF (DUF218 family)
VKEAGRLLLSGQGSLIIASCAYKEVWTKEWRCKHDMFGEMHIAIDQTAPLYEVLDSYDEACKAVEILESEGCERIIICSDRYHGPRAVRAFKREIARRGLEIEVAEEFFITLDYERTYEPHPNKILAAVKSWRAGGRWRWRLWNSVFGLIDRWA